MLENKGWIRCLYRKARYNGPIHCKHFFCPKERKNVHEAQSSPNKLDLANIRVQVEKEFLLVNWLKCTFILYLSVYSIGCLIARLRHD